MVHYANMRYVAIYRTSTSVQSEKSIPDQKKVVQHFTASKGMVHAGGDLEQSGISATKRKSREDIAGLIERKQKLDDFDAIVVHDYSRLSRKGALDSLNIEASLNANGIRLLSATEPVIEGPHATTIKAMLHSQHEEYARSHAQRIARGQSSSILNGISYGSGTPPFGIDRLYMSSIGKKNHIIRILADGSQVRLHPDTGDVLSYYEKKEPGMSRFYRKQPDERVIFVPGDANSLDIVRQIFKMYLIDGLGYFAIGARLYDQGIRTSKGRPWTQNTIKTIVLNPIYTGRLIANRYTRGQFYTRSKCGSTPTSDDSALSKTTPKLVVRPKDDWIDIPIPETSRILEPKLRELATAFQNEMMDKRLTDSTPAIKKDKHTDSEFFLKDVLRCKERNLPMKGFSTRHRARAAEKRYRYYVPRGFGKCYDKTSMVNHRIPAVPLEAMALNVLARVVESAPDLFDKVKEQVVQLQSRHHEKKTHGVQLEDQRRNLIKKITTLADIAGEFDDELVDKVSKMKVQLRELDSRIKSAKAEPMLGDPEQIAQNIVDSLTDMKGVVAAAPGATLRRMMQLLVERMECDTIHREVWAKFSVPSWAVEKMGGFSLDKVCLDYGCLETPVGEANNMLLAEVHMWCLPQVPSSKKFTRLESYRYAITGGVLKCDGEHVPTAVEPPQPRPVVMKAAPVDSGAWWGDEWGLTAPWTFGASLAA